MQRVFFVTVVLFILATFALPVQAETCGDNLCEFPEDSCKCPADCKGCSGPAKGFGPCKVHGCIGKTCTVVTATNCCPNLVCEQTSEYSENYGSCPADCKPASLQFEVVEPSGENIFAKGQTVKLKVKIFADGKEVIGAKAFAYGFFGKTDLFNDGKHDDGTNLDNIYAGSFVVPAETADGSYKIDLNATFREVMDSNAIAIAIKSTLGGSMTAAEKKYKLGDTISLTGIVNKLKDGKPLKMKLVLASDNRTIAGKDFETDAEGNFSVEHESTLENQLGMWKATASGTDEAGNFFELNADFNMTKEVVKDELEISFVKGPKEKYERGEKMEVSVALSLNDGPVKFAIVELISPLNEVVTLKEAGAGTYSGFYYVAKDVQLSKQQFKIEAFKAEKKSNYESALDFNAEITAGKIVIEIIEPKEDKRFEPGEVARLKVKLTYPSGAYAENAELTAEAEGDSFKFKEDTKGVFVANFSLRGESRDIELLLKAKDEQGNYGEKKIALGFGPKGGLNLLLIGLGIVALAVLGAILFFLYRGGYLSSFFQKKPEQPKEQISIIERE